MWTVFCIAGYVNNEILFRTLKAINAKQVIMIPKAFLLPTSGFGRLRGAGFLVVSKIDNKFYITLSTKGLLFISDYLASSGVL